MTTVFNEWFPTSQHGDPAINVMNYGAIADGVGHPLWQLGFTSLANAQNGTGGNGIAYPSATSTDDYADWCALTEAVKAAFSTDGVKHGSEGYKNRPLRIPAGRYIVNKPVIILDVASALIYGTGGYTQIYNENDVEPNNIAAMFDGFCFSRVENMAFGAVGTNCIALDINRTDAATLVNTNSNLWLNVNMSANGVGSVGCYIGRGNIMCSEQTFVRCINDYSDYGWIISNQNALSYVFLTSGGTFHKESCIRVNTGGCVTCINCFFAENGTDIDVYASAPTTCISCRSESDRFIRGGWNNTLIGCTFSQTHSEATLIDSEGQTFITGVDCGQARIQGQGQVRLEGNLLQHATHYISSVTNSGGLVKITHALYGWEDHKFWRDGDEVKILGVTGITNPTAPSVNGIWIIHKLNETSFELLGSTYVADTYDVTNGRMAPGPEYHITGVKWSTIAPAGFKPLAKTLVRDQTISWLYSGYLITNSGASAAVTVTLPDASDSGWRNMRGTSYRFVVIAPQSLTIRLVDIGASPPSRIYKAGGYTTGGTQITSNVMGSALELMLVDGQGAGPHDTTVDGIGHRWLVISETGTWTLSGTP